MEVFLRVSFHWDFLQLIIGFVLIDFSVRPILGILCPTNSFFCKGNIVPIFWTDLKTFSKSDQNTLFHFVSTCSKKIIHKEIDDSCHGFSCSWTPAMGSSVFSNAASISDRSRAFVPSVPELAHATVSNTVRGNIDQLVWEPCHNYAVPCQVCSTSVWGHSSCHMQVSSILQQYMVDDLLLVAIDTRHHDSHHKTVLEGRLFGINVKKIPTFAGCHLATHLLVLWKQGNRFAGNPSACLGNFAVPISPLP